MVKRQTVWLSTMMVLSLMLIGYYTMNNQSSTVSTGASGTTVSTTASDQTSNTSSGSTSGSNSTSTTSAKASTDWFTSTQTSVDQQMSQQMDRLKSEMANNNASADQISQASKQLGQLQSLDAGLGNAEQAIKADGFKNVVIVPDQKQENFTVYVQTSNLQKADVIKVMNIVSQQLDVSMLNVSVKAHA